MLITRDLGGYDSPVFIYPPAMQQGRGDPWRRFRQAVRTARHERHITQGDLAKKAGISRPALSGLESGKTKAPERETVEAVASALRWTREYVDGLLSGTGPLEEPPAEPLSRDALAVARLMLPHAGPTELELYVRAATEIERLTEQMAALRRDFGNQH
jgi:transcriptional regulator with XRE-family HTH domain